MTTLNVNGVNLAYDEAGTGSPALLFVHGWCCDRSFFAPQAEHFSTSHRVVSIDLRGHGDSDRPEGPYSIKGFADDLAGAIEKLDLGKAIAIGHSLGGDIVLQLAAAHADLVAGIVMVDPPPLSLPKEFRELFEGIIASIEAGDREPQRRAVEGMFPPTSDKALVERVVSVMTSAPAHVAVAELEALFEFDGVAAAAACSVPALHIAQRSSNNPPHPMSQWLPHVVHGWADGEGHFIQLESPAEVNSMVEDFLNLHLGIAGSG